MTMLKSLFVYGLILVSLNGWTQSEIKNVGCMLIVDSFGIGEIYSYVDSMPHYPGGDDLLDKFILESLRIPEDFISWNSKVITQFVVDTIGRLTDKKIIRGLNEDLNNEVLAVLNKMPSWVPGKCNGRLVPVVFVLPVIIRLK